MQLFNAVAFSLAFEQPAAMDSLSPPLFLTLVFSPCGIEYLGAKNNNNGLLDTEHRGISASCSIVRTVV